MYVTDGTQKEGDLVSPELTLPNSRQNKQHSKLHHILDTVAQFIRKKMQSDD
jgi:hypothetical protein